MAFSLDEYRKNNKSQGFSLDEYRRSKEAPEETAEPVSQPIGIDVSKLLKVENQPTQQQTTSNNAISQLDKLRAENADLKAKQKEYQQATFENIKNQPSSWDIVYPEETKALQEQNKAYETLKAQYQTAKAADKYQYGEKDYSWKGAVYDVGQLQLDASHAWTNYIQTGNEEYKKQAQTLTELANEIQANNESDFEAKNKIDQAVNDVVGYLPQVVDQAKTIAPVALLGALTGGIAAPGLAAAIAPAALPAMTGIGAGYVAGSGLYSLDTVRGSVYGNLVDMGIDEETARKASMDEAIVSSIIEMADAGLDLFAYGGGKLLKSIGITPVKEQVEKLVGKSLTNKLVAGLAKYGLGAIGEGIEEGTQEAVSIANERILENGEDYSIGKLIKNAADIYTNRKDQPEEDQQRIKEAARAGRNIGLVMGGAATIKNNAITAAVAKKNIDAIANDLESRGSTENTRQKAEALYEVMSGYEVSDKKVEQMFANKETRDIIEETVPEVDFNTMSTKDRKQALKEIFAKKETSKTENDQITEYASIFNIKDPESIATLQEQYDPRLSTADYMESAQKYFNAGLKAEAKETIQDNKLTQVQKDIIYNAGQQAALNLEVGQNGEEESRLGILPKEIRSNSETSSRVSGGLYSERSSQNGERSSDRERTPGQVARENEKLITINSDQVNNEATRSSGTVEKIGSFTNEENEVIKQSKEDGYNVHLFKGGNITNSFGQQCNALINGKEVWIRTDDKKFSAKKLYLHETAHPMLRDDKGATKYRNQLKDKLVSKFGDAGYQELLDDYINTIYDGLTESEIQDIYGISLSEYVEDEMLADLRAGMNVFKGTNLEEKYQPRYEVGEKTAARIENETRGSPNAEARFSALAKDFEANLRKWDQKNTTFSFNVGTTSKVLLDIGVPDRPIKWDASKIKKILTKHKEMTIDVIAQVPQILENPILVMKSKTVDGRLVLFGDVVATNGKPVLAALEINPNENGETQVEVMKVASAYAKDNSLQNFIDSSEILYVDPNKKRTNDWLKLNRLQLPLANSQSGSTNNVSQAEQDVNNNSEVGRFSMQSPVEETEDLVALHNLKPEDVKGVFELGGFAMPSIAVVKASKGHSDYGPISVVFPKSTIDPKASSKNKVYGGDAWTPVFPRKEYKANKSVVDKGLDIIHKNYKPIPNFPGVYWDYSDIEKRLNENNGDIGKAFDNNESMKLAFLNATGKKIELPMAEPTYDGFGHFDNDVVKTIAKKFSPALIDKWYETSGGINDKTIERLRKVVNDTYFEKFSDIKKKIFKDGLYSKEDFGWNRAYSLVEAIRKYNHNEGKTVVDKYAAIDKINAAVNQEEYENWLREIFDGVVEKTGIRNNQDYYTYSGNPRSWNALHYEYTLENVVKAMKQNNNAKGNAVFGGTDIWAVSQKDYPTISSLKKDSSRLQTMNDEEYEKLRHEYMSMFTELCQSILPKSSNNPFIEMDYAAGVLIDAVRHAKTVEGIQNYLDREYKKDGYYQFKSDTAERLAQIVDLMANMPTGYFEAKPERVVGINEILAAVIPNNTDNKVKTLLKDNNVNTLEYEDGNEEDRLVKINSVENARFSTITPEVDQRYLELAKDPEKNAEALQQMIDQAARINGYNIRMYHGTRSGKRFNVFNTKEVNNNMGAHFGTTLAANAFANGDQTKLYNVLLKAENPFETFDWFGADDYYPAVVAYDLANEIGTKEAWNLVKEIEALDPEAYKGLTEGTIFESSEADGDFYLKDRQKEAVLYSNLRNLLDMAKYDSMNYENDLEDFGYTDYVIQNPEQIKLADLVTYDDNGNIIPLSERFNSSSSDIRFSQETRSDVEKQVKELSKELGKYQRRNTYLERQLKRTIRQSLKQSTIKAISSDIKKQYDSTLDDQAIRSKVDEISKILLNDSTPDNADQIFMKVKEQSIDLASEVVGNASALVEDGNRDLYKQLRAYFKKLNLRQEKTGDIPDFSAWKQQNRDIINVYKDKGRGIDSYWSELQQLFGKDLFPDEIDNSTDQLLHVVDVIRSLEPTYENPFSFEMSEAVEECSNDILNQIVGKLDQTMPKTFADRQNDKLVAQKQKDRERLNKAIEDGRKRTQQAIANERAKRDQAVQRVKNHFKEVAARKAGRKADSEARTRLLKIMRRLNEPNKMSPNQALIQQYIGDLDLVAKSMTGKTLKDLTALEDWYLDQKNNNPDFIADAATEKKLQRLHKKQIKDLSIEEVLDLTEVLLNIENEIRTQRKLIDSQIKEDMAIAGDKIIRDIQASAGKEGGKADTFIVENTLSPTREIRRIVGYREDDPLYIATLELDEGQRKMLDYQMKAMEPFRKFAEDKEFTKSITGKKARTIELVGTAKGTFTKVFVTPDIAIELYLNSFNDQNMAHIQDGGVELPDIELYKKGKFEEAYDKSVLVKFTKSQLRAIKDKLTEKELAYGKLTWNYFNNVSSPAINETSLLLKGYYLANVENYYPIHTSRNFLKSEFDTMKFDGTIEGMGWTKERINARNPIIANGVTRTLNQAIQQHSKYIGLAIPVRNFNKLFGINQFTITQEGKWSIESSVQRELKAKWGSTAYNYIQKMMTDLQTGSGKSDDWSKVFNQIRSKYAGAVLSLNASVALKQAASYPTAAAVVGWKALGKALASTSKPNLELINKYTPLLWYRSQGFSTQELGDMASRNAKLPKGLNWIQGVDVLTTTKLWKAAEYFVRDKNKGLQVGTDAYYKEVAKVYNQIIEETQPNYTTLQRPQLLRSDNQLVQMFFMFKTQPFQNFNILYDALGNLEAKHAENRVVRSAETKERLNQAKQDVRKAVTSQLVQLAVFAAMTALWNFFRGKKDKYKDEEGNVTFESVTTGITKDMASSLFAEVPFGTEVWEALASVWFGDKYYGFDAITASSIDDLFQSLIKVAKLVQNPDDWKDPRHLRLELDNAAKQASKFAGIPYENIENLINATYRWVAVAALGEYEGTYQYLKLTTDATKYKKEYYDNLYKAYVNDREAYNKIYKDMLKDDRFTKDQIKTNLEKRMKEDQGVLGVEFLSERWMTPEEQKRYDKVIEKVSNTDAWKAANESQKIAAKGDIQAFNSDDPSNEIKARKDWLKDGNLSETEYILYQLALDIVDKPNANGDMNTYTAEEKKEAIKLAGLTKKEGKYITDGMSGEYKKKYEDK